MYQDFNGKIGISQFTPSAKRVYDKSGYFNDFKLSEGYKFAIRSNLKNVLPLINPRFKKHNFNSIDYIFNIWFNVYNSFSERNIRKRIPKNISVDYLSEIDSETSDFIKKHQENDIFKKNAEFFNWIKRFPWILPAPLHKFSKKESYEFSMFSEEKFDNSFLKIRQKIPKNISVDYLSEIDSETSDFIKKHQENDIFKKNAEFFNWIKRFPWILPAPLHKFSKKESYEFSMFSEEKFDYSFLKIRQNKKVIGFIVIQQRDYNGKILFSYFDKENQKVISDIILLHLLNTEIRDFICYDKLICDYLKTKKFFFIYKNKKVKHSIISKSFDLSEIKDLRFQYGDGDCAFA